jgi:hypothetical protein
VTTDIALALEAVVEAFEVLGIRYRVGGSVASSLHGVPRSTLDVDVVCDVADAHAEPLASLLRGSFYVDADMIRDAVRRRASFNVIHLATMMKVDVFVLRRGVYDRASFERSSRKSLEPGTREIELATAEDTVLRKLEWYRLGNQISERQWLDVLGVLRVQQGAIDRTYLRRWAADLDVVDLLERALREAEG